MTRETSQCILNTTLPRTAGTKGRKAMLFIKPRCSRCGGNLYLEYDSEITTCLMCSRPSDLQGRLLTKRLVQPRKYERDFKIPRSLRLFTDLEDSQL